MLVPGNFPLEKMCFSEKRAKSNNLRSSKLPNFVSWCQVVPFFVEPSNPLHTKRKPKLGAGKVNQVAVRQGLRRHTA